MILRVSRLGLMLVVALTTLAAELSAQERKKFSFVVPPGVSKYTQTHVIEVGDVPGHQLRIFELRSVYADQAPVYDGVKVKETFARAVSDYIDGSGTASGYTVDVLENGEKIFSRLAIQSQTMAAADGSKKLGFRTVRTITGGTGRFSGIRGTILGGGGSDLKTGTTDNWNEGEYWIDK